MSLDVFCVSNTTIQGISIRDTFLPAKNSTVSPYQTGACRCAEFSEMLTPFQSMSCSCCPGSQTVTAPKVSSYTRAIYHQRRRREFCSSTASSTIISHRGVCISVFILRFQLMFRGRCTSQPPSYAGTTNHSFLAARS